MAPSCSSFWLTRRELRMDLHPTAVIRVAKTLAATFGVGCAALIALTAAMPVSGGHINPAITVAVATMGHFPWSRVIPYLVAQHLGGFCAGLMIYVTFKRPSSGGIYGECG